MNYGQMIEQWPELSSGIRQNLDDFTESDLEELPEEDTSGLLAYATSVATAHDQLGRVVAAVSGFVRDDEPESAIATAYEQATETLDRLDDAREQALTPGVPDEEGE